MMFNGFLFCNEELSCQFYTFLTVTLLRENMGTCYIQACDIGRCREARDQTVNAR